MNCDDRRLRRYIGRDRNPASRIKVGQYEYAVLQPLVPEQVARSVAAATTPATRLVLALAAVHAARVA
ncbi:hypothetical protein [Streptomyces cadmiisoli]|uniref:hypothetical protein n=1 Tax=Streptomyces cadmiisoli TaxID=2184053 RepID=UPI00365E9C10